MPVERIVGRDLLRCHVGGGHELIKRNLGNGHVECRVVPIKTWEFVAELSDQAYADRLAELEATTEERKQANLERAAMRAKQRVRHLCKARGYDSLLTLTYRANMTDRATLQRHMQEFNRRMKVLIPDWSYAAAYEKQKRGAWHVHMAVRRIASKLLNKSGIKVKSFDVVRSVWHSVVGELGGNIDIDSKKRNCRRAPSKIAAYLSKYMVKAFEEGEPWSNRYSASKGEPVPKPERIRFLGYSLCDVTALSLDDVVTSCAGQLSIGLSRWKDSIWWILDTNIRPRWVEP